MPGSTDRATAPGHARRTLGALTEPAKLSATARSALTLRSNDLIVSAATAWEIATKHRIGRLPAAEALVLGYPEHLARLGASELPIDGRVALAAGGLVWEHRDPFDRMLAAQALILALPLVTADVAFTGLPGLQTLW